MSKKIMLVLVAFLLVVSQSVEAQEWVKIAEKTVNFKAEKDEITPQGGEKNVDKIRIKCLSGTVKLKQVSVEMSDGSKADYDAKGVGVLTKGMASLSWDLPGKGKDVKLKKVILQYDSMGNMILTDKAKVELQGKPSKN